MEANIDEYLEIYKQACTAYAQQNYEVAATLVDSVVENLPDDANCHLLRGHVYYVLQQYDVASSEYQKVLQLTKDEEIISFARNGLENVNQYQQQEEQIAEVDNEPPNSSEPEAMMGADNEEDNFDLSYYSEHPQAVDVIEELSFSSPFEMPTDSTVFGTSLESNDSADSNPFVLNAESQLDSSNSEEQSKLDLPAFWEEDVSQGSKELGGGANYTDINYPINSNNSSGSPFEEFVPSTGNSLEKPPDFLIEVENSQGLISEEFKSQLNNVEDETLFLSEVSSKNGSKPTNNSGYSSPENNCKSSSLNGNFTFEEKSENLDSTDKKQNGLDDDDSFDFEAFESAFGSDALTDDEDTNSIISGNTSKSNNIEFLDDFDAFDDLGNIPGFDITGGNSSFSDVSIPSGSLDTSSKIGKKVSQVPPTVENSDLLSETLRERDSELFSMTGSQEAVPVFTQTDVSKVEPVVNVEQGLLAPLENAPLEQKQWIIAGTVGIVSAVVVAVVSFSAANLSAPQQREGVRNTGWAMALAAGLASFGTASFMGNLTLKQIRRTTNDLQTQFDAVRQGNLNAQATVYSEDQLGQLAAGFNEMAKVIFTTTNEAQRKADEQEEAKENLQRQVIRLLDDVEGAARGDLTVQAEVTADVLGAVADAFNLTIQNLRDIVQQVKVAAREVTKGATNSETFARALSSDALRQAEELAVTLNSVQVMTDSIQRVAEAAREAETVTREASAFALKGGEAVENTVAGILEIRETVAETTRKVKRLAESSQEISKIVALISQIASRTNLLALNASIEAARAGEAGRGFAIVADEVRQLADRSAKSLKEIEEIVRQIQSETSSVMTAMEEGTQQVIQGTKLAEEAKRSLENIIQVANRIDILVRSITTDTVEQTETSRAVAQVMQSVELTAQETSQEAQRVSGALQHLVGVSRDLISSVERFKVETLETR
ncbi:methyl-accepting chemotaxis sensory transducer [Tolypothrix sp. NIES-4075]|uniref:methyl-accepting chemotaxis protein n=1 Tax=Tolypothrix sp. NIES-4075 TaxID=2005459 RepID=UPI000B5CC0AB|nr:HAMP domain-containing methyl-accepting chemotaxis protein [Tolypothrix sp. NIES-4075]GAX42520.1 methyl-accepting chemotaxis sensory transducer [Tolypothrix sp. NIES-4075]